MAGWATIASHISFQQHWKAEKFLSQTIHPQINSLFAIEIAWPSSTQDNIMSLFTYKEGNLDFHNNFGLKILDLATSQECLLIVLTKMQPEASSLKCYHFFCIM